MSEPQSEEDQRTEQAIKLAAGDNTAAASYLRLIGRVARMVDDLEDCDHGSVDIGLFAFLVLVALPRNPFFQANLAHLVALHDTTINAWQDANEMDPHEQSETARCWADYANEIAPAVCGLTQGYDARRRLSPQIRALLYCGWSSGKGQVISDLVSDKGYVIRDKQPLTTNH
jgi:hypothetical protein